MKSWVGVGRWVGDQRDAGGMLTHLPDTACAKDQVQNESRMEGACCGGQSPDSESHFQPVHLICILFFSLVWFSTWPYPCRNANVLSQPSSPIASADLHKSSNPNKRTGSLWRWKNPWKDPSWIFQTSLHHKASSSIFYLLPTNSSKL